MRRYLARGIGVVIGLPAGPAGAVFGFLIGTLVDQYRRDAPTDAALDRYLARPSAERSGERAILYASAVLAAILIDPDTTDRDHRIADAAAMTWPAAGTAARRRLRRQAARARLIRRAAERLPMISRDAIIEDLGDRLVGESAHRFLETLAAVGSVTVAHVPTAAPHVQDVIDATAQSFGMESVAAAGRGTGESGLDEAACRLLGVGPDVNQDELRHTYRQLASQMHPDTGVALELYQQDELAGAFVRIRDAYERLLVQIEARDRRRI